MIWEVRRQQCGPLVMEKRFVRARAAAGDTDEDRREKLELRSKAAIWDDPVSRLECKLAHFGWYGIHYVLTFDAASLPGNFRALRRELRNFVRRLARIRQRFLGDSAYKAIFCVEGLHGGGRYHIHAVLDAREISEWQVQQCWGRGVVAASPVLLDRDAFRRLALYFRKERCDGERFPLGCHHVSSRGLPAGTMEAWRADTGEIRIPEGAVVLRQRGPYSTPFGGYAYAKYLAPDGSKACRTALARMQGSRQSCKLTRTRARF